jgi:CRISPR-associated protein Csb2
VAFAALPDVGHDHADGHLMGIAAILPRHTSEKERRTILSTLAALDSAGARLNMGPLGAFPIERIPGLPLQRALRAATWTAASKRWASVTPIVLDRFPKDPFGDEARQIVAASCVRAGYPKPSRVALSTDSYVLGVARSSRFPPVRREGRVQRYHVHAVLDFESPVSGPMLLGAGRYVGMGLCRAVREVRL